MTSHIKPKRISKNSGEDIKFVFPDNSFIFSEDILAWQISKQMRSRRKDPRRKSKNQWS